MLDYLAVLFCVSQFSYMCMGRDVGSESDGLETEGGHSQNQNQNQAINQAIGDKESVIVCIYLCQCHAG